MLASGSGTVGSVAAFDTRDPRVESKRWHKVISCQWCVLFEKVEIKENEDRFNTKNSKSWYVLISTNGLLSNSIFKNASILRLCILRWKTDGQDPDRMSLPMATWLLIEGKKIWVQKFPSGDQGTEPSGDVGHGALGKEYWNSLNLPSKA